MADKTPPPARQAHEPVEARRLYSLVAVGSSAGGIEALSTMLGTLPADFPVPIVVAQHLDPHQTSHLAEILAQRTPLLIHTITDHETLVPGIVYVVPSDRNGRSATGTCAC
jgi:chemotaxis response regulator CheB